MVADPDLQQVARDAIAAGLFNTDPDAVRVNASIDSRYQQIPRTLLDVPYVNGPIAIEMYGRDVPEATVFSVRRNFTEANRLLLPKDQVLRYFHQRFVADDVFTSDLLVRMVASYRARIPVEMDERIGELFRPSLIHHGRASDLAVREMRPGAGDGLLPANTGGIGKRFRDPALSFRIKGVDRRSRTRVLYTQEEQVEGLRLAQDAPALVLAILAYQSVLQRYLSALRQTFEAVVSGSVLTCDALSDFDKYTEQWGTQNFTNELVPALAIFMRIREHSLDESQKGRVVNAELFRDAVNFIIENGAFRNWITIPADVVTERVERVNHFLCPAVGAVREQVLDGSLLTSIYHVVAEKESAKDGPVRMLLEIVRAEAAKKLAELDRTLTGEDIARLQERATMSFSYRGKRYTLRLDAPSFQEFIRGEFKRDDITITAPIGSWFYDIAREAIAITLDRKTAVSFQFNDRGYRLTPGRLADFVRGNVTPDGITK